MGHSISAQSNDFEAIQLTPACTKGLGSLMVSAMKESATEINEELATAGQCLRAVAAQLYEVKQNVKSGNWKAFLESGAIHCTPKYASDLVSAHEKWLSSSDVDDALIAHLSPRSLAAMANATEDQRERVYKLRMSKGKERLSEAEVRKALKGSKSKSAPRPTKSVDERVSDLRQRNNKLKGEIKSLKEENKKLRQLIAT